MNEQLVLELHLLFLAYFFGSIPFSILLGKLIHNIDIRDHGSNNPGGTNAMRVLGAKTGRLVIFLDIMKGGLIIGLINYFGLVDLQYIPVLAYGTIAAFGHVFSIFIGFRGGKAVAATGGFLLGFNIIWALIAMFTFIFTVRKTKFVSVGSTMVGISVVVTNLVYGLLGFITNNHYFFYPYGSAKEFYISTLPFTIVIAFLIIIRHRENYKRIKEGTERVSSWFQKK